MEKKLEVTITGIPQEWIGQVRVKDLEEKGTPHEIQGGYYHITLENPELALKLMREHLGWLVYP